MSKGKEEKNTTAWGRRFLTGLLCALMLCTAAVPVNAGAFVYGAEPEEPQLRAEAADEEFNDDAVTRTDLFITDMIHDNPGLQPYDSVYNDMAFLKSRGYDGKVFSLNYAAQFGLLWDAFDAQNGVAAADETGADNDQKVYPYGSESRAWAEAKKAELKAMYQEAKDQGLKVCFMMDFITLPSHLVELYPSVLSGGRIDIMNTQTKKVMDFMLAEMFTEFPEIDGIYVRYGENYVGQRYGSPYHRGNNPIVGDTTKYHLYLINYLRDRLCEGNYLTSTNGAWEGTFQGAEDSAGTKRDLIYRTWGFGAFQRDKNTYLSVSDQIAPHDHLYFAIKYSAGDFLRTASFNQCLGVGAHQQIVEIQCAREYEGKGAYPNYIGNDVINGGREYAYLNGSSDTKSLRDIVNVPNSKIKGLWTWSRGGGWAGPYLNGNNGIKGKTTGANREIVIEDGSELWIDLNAYVIAAWAQDTSKTDQYYVKQYAREVLGMNDEDAERFYQICLKSSDAVLYGLARGTTNNYPNSGAWTRDQNLDANAVKNDTSTAVRNGSWTALLQARGQSVQLWKEMTELAAQLTTGDQKTRDYIGTTCAYGYDLFRIYESIFKARIYSLQGETAGKTKALYDYDRLWDEWRLLSETAAGCPSLFEKDNVRQDLIAYSSNVGLDGGVADIRSGTYDWIRALQPGETLQLPAGSAYYSLNKEVATVSLAGAVTGEKDGVTRISYQSGDSLKAVLIEVNSTGKVTKEVTPKLLLDTYPDQMKLIDLKKCGQVPGYLEEVSLTNSGASVKVKGTGTLASGAAEKEIVFNDGNTASGIIHFGGKGNVQEVAVSYSGDNKTATFQLLGAGGEEVGTAALSGGADLLQVDLSWSEEGGDSTYQFSNLPEGNYLLTVRKKYCTAVETQFAITSESPSSWNGTRTAYAGDLNENGKIDEDDAQWFLRILETQEAQFSDVCDLTGNGRVTFLDYVLFTDGFVR